MIIRWNRDHLHSTQAEDTLKICPYSFCMITTLVNQFMDEYTDAHITTRKKEKYFIYVAVAWLWPKLSHKHHINRKICWGKSINEKSINRLIMHSKRTHYGTFRKKCFISYVCISHVNILVSIDTFALTLKTLPRILLY